MSDQKSALLPAILKARCPYCRIGPVFAGMWRMHSHCPHCGIQYEREQGYFMMAIFFGYVLNAIIFLPICIVLYLNGVPYTWYIWVAGGVILLEPWIFRYARVIWLHVDELLDPRRDPPPIPPAK